MMFLNLLKLVLGTKSQRDIRRLKPLVAKINEIEVSYQSLTDDQLKAKTPEFKERLTRGETVDDLLCEGFATVKNALPQALRKDSKRLRP